MAGRSQVDPRRGTETDTEREKKEGHPVRDGLSAHAEGDPFAEIQVGCWWFFFFAACL